MGFFYHAIRIPRAITVTFFLNVFGQARFFFIGALTHLGLYKPPPREDPDASDNSNNYMLIVDGAFPSLVPVPVHVVTRAIKDTVPILRYREFILGQKQEGGGGAERDDVCEQKVCSICLEGLDREHEIREPCNCSHLFHRECLDTWIDEGQVSCPLCRSMLLPPKVNIIRYANENRGGVPENDSHLVDP